MRQCITIIRWELWQRRWALLWWSVGVAALVGIDMLLYAAVKDQAKELNQIMNNLSPAFRSLFSGGVDILSPVGFLSARVYYLLLPLVLSIFTIVLGTQLIGKEERQGTLELLLARPLSRTKLLFGKLTAGTMSVAVLGMVALVVAFICLGPSGLTGISHKALALTTLGAVLLSSLFGMIAFALTALGQRTRRMAVGIAALFALTGHILASLENTIHWLHWPAKILPYHYYRPSSILGGASSQKREMLGFIIVILLLAVVSWYGFRRRDIG